VAPDRDNVNGAPTESLLARVGGWEVEVFPARGGRITSLRCGHMTEWLAGSGRTWPPATPTRWVDGDVRGWDECFPNIAAGRHPETGAILPDHGDLWNSAARCETVPGGLRTSWTARSVGVRVERELVGAGDDLAVTYTASAVAPVSVGWAMHLLLDVAPTAITMDDEVPVRVDSVFGAATAHLRPSPPNVWLRWRDVRASLPLEAGGWAAKLNTLPGSTSELRVAGADDCLAIAVTDTPFAASFGLWFNADGLGDAPGVRHVGVEPCFGDHDDFGAALASGSALPLTTTPTRWSVRLSHPTSDQRRDR
jgi:hypothetical protein